MASNTRRRRPRRFTRLLQIRIGPKLRRRLIEKARAQEIGVSEFVRNVIRGAAA